jgi:type III pantothenate kinase
MLLAVDAGNTNINFAVFDNTTRKSLWRIKTDSARTVDEYISFLIPLFQSVDLKPADIDHVIVSSVVPDANFSLRMLSHQMFHTRPDFIGKDITDLGVEVKIDKPEELGADRLVNTVGVIAYYKPPAIVVDFGTATTLDVVDRSGAFIGGAIAPGINLSLNALYMAAAKLPKVSISRPPKVIATNTVTAMQSGVYWGYVELISGMIRRMHDELGEKMTVIATGGLSSLFQESIDLIDHVDEDLTLKGLLTIYQRYRQK